MNPNLDRRFTYPSVKEYYDTKVTKFIDVSLQLPNSLFNTVEDLVRHLRDVQGTLGITFPNCSLNSKFIWENYITSLDSELDKQKAWVYRDYVFSVCMIHVGIILGQGYQGQIEVRRQRPSGFDITNNMFTVIGSQNLTSDIDVTVQGPHAAFVISVIEDLFEVLTYDHSIPLRCMDVEFYGDFRILTNLYVNVSLFSDADRLLMLEYAYISYFRSLHTDTVSPLGQRLGELYLQKMSSPENIQTVIQRALDTWTTEAPNGELIREKFYDANREAEESANRLLTGGLAKNSSAYATEAPRIFFLIAKGNVHRPESYIVPSTPVHVVELEQVLGMKNAGRNTPPISKDWFTKNATIGLDTFAYIASAIEQLGYLEHYHTNSSECNKKGIKYFGRMVRALIYAKLLKKDTYQPVYNAFNNFRKSSNTRCPYNIHTYLDSILRDLTQNRNSGGGKRRHTKKMRNKRRTHKKRSSK